MNYLLRTILAARNYDEDSGWMQLLVFIIIAVIYAISGFIRKTREGKAGLEDDQQLEEMLGQQRHRQRQQVRPAREKAVSTQQQKPAGVEAAIEPLQAARLSRKRPGGHIKPAETPHVTKLSSSVPAFQPAIKERHGAISESPEEQAAATEKAKRRKAVKALADLSNPDELRKAIVHYEIIGKPISLRE